jgi:hypothetical protein
MSTSASYNNARLSQLLSRYSSGGYDSIDDIDWEYWPKAMPRRYLRPCIARIGDYIYVTSTLPYETIVQVCRYNLQTREWSRARDCITPRQYAASCVMNGRWYISGGLPVYNGNDTCSNTMEVYDPVTDRWRLISTSMKYPRHRHAMCVYDQRIWVIGCGHIVESFDPITETWHVYVNNPLPDECMNANGIALRNGLLVFAGGTSVEQDRADATHVYFWTPPSLSDAKAHATTAMITLPPPPRSPQSSPSIETLATVIPSIPTSPSSTMSGSSSAGVISIMSKRATPAGGGWTQVDWIGPRNDMMIHRVGSQLYLVCRRGFIWTLLIDEFGMKITAGHQMRYLGQLTSPRWELSSIVI